MLVHHDGSIVAPELATLPLFGVAARFGLVVHEGVRVYRTHDGAMQPWLLDEHLARLQDSCRAVGLDYTCIKDVPEVLAEVLAANSLSRDCYVLITASAASVVDTPRPYEAVLTVAVLSIGHRKWMASGEGMSVTIRELEVWSSRDVHPQLWQLSTYARRRLALSAVQGQGYDDAALLNENGRVMGSTSATLFLVEGDALITPPAEDAGVPGIMRTWVMNTANKIGRVAREEPVTADRLKGATELFLCGTGVEFACIRTIDDIMVPDWPRYSTTTALCDVMFAQARAG
jgi:branched-chain amino acid aminotransferase